jgi:hypothetical protein
MTSFESLSRANFGRIYEVRLVKALRLLMAQNGTDSRMKQFNSESGERGTVCHRAVRTAAFATWRAVVA